MSEPTAGVPRPDVRYFEPLERAWNRMVEQLFRPFDLARWIALGFTCWLARFLQGGWGGGGLNFNVPTGGWGGGSSDVARVVERGDRSEPNGLAELFGRLADLDFGDLALPGFVGCLLIGVVVVAVTVMVVLMWLGSRGQFMFLDNVLHHRTEIVRPWKEYRREGNSLFLFQLVFGLIVLAAVLVVMLPGIFLLFGAIGGAAGGAVEGPWLAGPALLGVAAMVLPAMAIGLVGAYVGFFLLAFVVPIMHRERLTTMAAWRVFLPVFRAEWPHFLLVGLFVLALHVAVGIAVMVAGLATCCILLVVLAVPFIGTVLLLPVWLTYRVYTLEYLAQFSPRFDFFEAAAAEPA